MEIVLVLLAGILMGAFNFGFFCLGYFVRSKKPNDPTTEVTAENVEQVKKILDWIGYGGMK